MESDKSKELNLNSSFPKVLTVSDLCYCWEMTRQFIHGKIKVSIFSRVESYISIIGIGILSKIENELAL